MHVYREVSEQFRKIVAGAILQTTCARNCHNKLSSLVGRVCVYTLLAQGMVDFTCSYKNMQGAQGHSGRLGPTKTLPVCRANIPASDAPGRSGRSWWSQTHTIPCI